MTVKDRQSIKRLYFFNNYTQATLSRLFGLSKVRIFQIISEQDTTYNTSEDCKLCPSENASPFFIDGNEDNHIPQNLIMLCEFDKRRIGHLQLRRKEVLLKSPL